MASAEGIFELAQGKRAGAEAARKCDDSGAALALYEEAISLLRPLDRPQMLAHWVRHQGDVLRQIGRLSEAESCYAEALAIYRNHPDSEKLDLANTIRGYALLKALKRDKAGALELWREAGTLYEQVGIEAGVAEARLQITELQG